MQRHHGFFIIFVLLNAIACQQYEPKTSVPLASNVPFCTSGDSLGKRKPDKSSVDVKAIYQEDNRKDWFEVSGPLKEHWAAATVALVNRTNMRMVGDRTVLRGPRHGTAKNLCSGQPFENQPEVAFCSGFLVAENLVVTAAHCIRNDSDCQKTSFVFDYAKTMEGQESYSVPTDSIYQCRKVVSRDLFLNDFAVIELSESVRGRTPLNVRREGEVAVGDDLVMIGHPSGLPSKIASGGRVRSVGQQIFAEVDAFAGNSGSVVLNRKTGLVEGLLVAGEIDYISDGRRCFVEYVCDEKCKGEIITPIGSVLSSIPNKLYEAPEVPCL